MVSERFANDIIEACAEAFPEYDFDLMPIKKNNDVVLTGLVARINNTIRPVIYLDSMSGKTLHTIVKDIGRTLKKFNPEFDISGLVETLADKRTLLSRVMPKIVSDEQDLSDFIYSDFVDGLKVLFYVPVDQPDVNSMATITLRKEHWNFIAEGVTVQNLFDSARENIKEDVFVCPLDSLLGLQSIVPMIVCSNKKHFYGAGVMLDLDTFDLLSLGEKDLYIIPASLHEILIVPVFDDGYASKILDIIREVNRTSLSATDVLSNNLYRYCFETRTIIKEEV